MSDERVVAPTSRRYTKAQKEQAVRPVRQIRAETGERARCGAAGGPSARVGRGDGPQVGETGRHRRR